MAIYDDQMEVGFAGMKADSGEDRVESFPVGTAGLGFGLVTGTNATGELVPGAGTQVRGISVHSHAIPREAYEQFDCASVMTRGLVWAQVTPAGTVTPGGPVSFAATGTVADAGANVLANAIFRGASATVTGGTIAVVELHAPFSVPAAEAP